MAPEGLDESAPIDGRADLWSVAMVLYELIAGRHAFAFGGRLEQNPFLLGNSILDEPHVPLLEVAPLCPASLARLVDRALSKRPEDRHASAMELMGALSVEMAAFAREHGPAPPLEQLAAQVFPDRAPRKESLKDLQGTALLDPKARAQPSALPYQRTPIAGAMAEAVSRASPEPEPPRVSDVFLKRRPPADTVRDPGGAGRGVRSARAACQDGGRRVVGAFRGVDRRGARGGGAVRGRGLARRPAYRRLALPRPRGAGRSALAGAAGALNVRFSLTRSLFLSNG